MCDIGDGARGGIDEMQVCRNAKESQTSERRRSNSNEHTRSGIWTRETISHETAEVGSVHKRCYEYAQALERDTRHHDRETMG